MTHKTFDEEILKIKVKENYDCMVNIVNLMKQAKINYVIDKKVRPFLRKAFAKRFIKACKDFNKQGYIVRIESVYRSVDFQRKLFNLRCVKIQQLHPNKPIEKIKEMANVFTAGIPIIAAHIAGAAIDITLLDAKHNPIDFGCEYRHGTSKSFTNCKKLSKKQKYNRKIMVSTMSKYDLINYPYEY